MEFNVTYDEAKIRSFENGMKAFRQVLAPQVKRILVENGKEVFRRAKEDVPVDTGNLRDHIFYEELENGIRIFTRDVIYDVFVEYGTRKMAAQPFMTPAYLSRLVYVMEELQEMHSDLIKEITI